MADQPLLTDENLERARALLNAMEAGDESTAAALIGELASARDSDLYQSVGRIARSVHDSVAEIQLTPTIGLIDEQEFPDARERLNHVIKLTADSAHTTLNAVEQGLPMVEDLERRAVQLHERWCSFRARQMSLDDFRTLSDDVEVFLGDARQSAQTLNGELSEVLMAQGFQDLTGQMIRQVIRLVDEVESGLVELVSRVGGSEASAAAEGVEAEGPQLPSRTQGVVKDQGDVDDLLASLGF